MLAKVELLAIPVSELDAIAEAYRQSTMAMYSKEVRLMEAYLIRKIMALSDEQCNAELKNG